MNGKPEPPMSAVERYDSNRFRSRQMEGGDNRTRYSAKSVDHIRDYMEKKKQKDILFSHIKNHINIVEFEKYIKANNPDMN